MAFVCTGSQPSAPKRVELGSPPKRLFSADVFLDVNGRAEEANDGR
jgi:hypothetical protein